MCINLPSYNNALSRIYLRNLDSIFQQEYQNYHLVYVNDASTDGTGDYVKAYMEEN
jgi:glycosyltransferase involved in cell wall biosynthesis